MMATMKRVVFWRAAAGSPTLGCQPTTDSDDISRGAAAAPLAPGLKLSTLRPSELSPCEAPFVPAAARASELSAACETPFVPSP